MPTKGQLDAKNLEAPPPSLTSPYHTGPQHFVDVSILKFEYETRAENVARVVPNVFEVPDKPKAFVSFNYWGFSNVGTYTEVVQSVECTYRNETFFYPVRLYLDNDRAILAGREGFGIPKLTGVIDFDIAATSRSCPPNWNARRVSFWSQACFKPTISLARTMSWWFETGGYACGRKPDARKELWNC